jgi:hypothetical protein
MAEHKENARALRQGAQDVAGKRPDGLSGDELADFLASLGDLSLRVGVLEGRTDMLHESIQKSNELHSSTKDSIEKMNALLEEVKEMLSVYNKAKSTITVIGWLAERVRGLALFIGALAVIVALWKTGKLPAVSPGGH